MSVVCVMMSARLKKNPGAGISLVLLKSTRGTSGLTSPFDRRIAISNTNSFRTNLLLRDLRFNSSIFLVEIGVKSHHLLIQAPGRN